jgi:hypothetical protein
LIPRKLDVNLNLLKTFTLKEVEKFTFIDIVSKIGGFWSLSFKFFALFMPIYFLVFLNDLAKHIKQNNPNDKGKSLGGIIEKLKKRLSYLGLYYLHEKHKELQ